MKNTSWTVMTSNRVESLIQMYSSGMSGAQVARYFGVTQATVYYHLKRHRVRLHTGDGRRGPA